jgi:hypothetical protein
VSHTRSVCPGGHTRYRPRLVSTSSAPAADADLQALTRELDDMLERTMSPTARTRLAYGRPGPKGLRSRLRAARRQLRAPVGLRLPEQLFELGLPMRLPTDPVWVPRAATHPLGSRRSVSFYEPDGSAIPDEPRAAWLAAMVGIEQRRDRRIAATALYRHGCRVWVSTIFLGLDYGLGDGGPPILWETMIFVGGRGRSLGEDQYGRRYASRAAALAGHRQLVTTLRAAWAAPPARVRPAARATPWAQAKPRRRGFA